jgi:signal peptidase I
VDREEKKGAEKETGGRSKLRDYLVSLLFAVVVAVILKTFVIEAFRIPTSSMENTLMVGDYLLVNKLIYGASTPRRIPFTNVALPYLKLPALRDPKPGDIMVFEYPGNRDQVVLSDREQYIKRCVAVPSDTVEIVNRVLFVNGVIFPQLPEMKFENPRPNPKNHPNEGIFPKGVPWNQDNYGPLVVPRQGDTLALSPHNISQWKTFIEREGHEVRFGNGKEILIDGLKTSSYAVHRDYLFVMGDNRDNSLDSRFWGFLPKENVVGQAIMIYWSWDPEVTSSGLTGFLKPVRWQRIGSRIR